METVEEENKEEEEKEVMILDEEPEQEEKEEEEVEILQEEKEQEPVIKLTRKVPLLVLSEDIRNPQVRSMGHMGWRCKDHNRRET